MNERRLVELIFRRGRIARVDLAEATDMTGASVTRLVAGLEKMGFFEQTVEKSGARGQPKRLLTLRKSEFRAVGAYLYLDRIVGVMVDLSGKMLATCEHNLKNVQAVEIAELAQRIAQDLLTETKTKPDQFMGVGLSVPANYGSYGNLVRAHEMFPELDGSAIHEAARGSSPWPVYLENDGTSSALGEYLFGDHKSADPLFLIHIGYGLGGGAVLNGRPLRGAYGNACLPGALFPYNQPRPTLQDLQATLECKGLSYDEIISGTMNPIADIPILQEWVDRAADQLIHAIKVISGMFDPEIIVLSGALSHSIIVSIAEVIQQKTIEGPSRGLRAAPTTASSLGDLSGPIGAACIPFFSTFFPGSGKERGNRYLNGRKAAQSRVRTLGSGLID